MDRGSWRATAHGIAESGSTEGLTHSHAPSNIIDYTTNLILKTTISVLYKMGP